MLKTNAVINMHCQKLMKKTMAFMVFKILFLRNQILIYSYYITFFFINYYFCFILIFLKAMITFLLDNIIVPIQKLSPYISFLFHPIIFFYTSCLIIQ